MIFALVIIWFAIPFSPVISEFKSDVVCLKNGNTFEPNGVFDKSDLEMLPMPIQKYIEGCGYVGTPEMKYVASQPRSARACRGLHALLCQDILF